MNRVFFACTVLLCLFLPPLWAQSLSGSSGRYVIEQRYVQHLAWIGDDYTLKYEVVIEQNEAPPSGAHGENKIYMKELTEEPHLQVSLPLGKYRYRVIPYDYLEQPGEASDWVYIEINPVPLVPVEVKTTEDGDYVLHHNENKPLIPGVNEIVIVNPEELETEDGVLAVKPPIPEKPFQFYLSAAWEPTIPLYGGMSDTFGNEFYAAGAAIRFGLFYNKLFTWLNPGLELSTSWYTLNKVQNKDMVGLTAGIIGINIVAQKRLLDRILAVTLRIGGAVAFQTGEFSDGEYSYLMSGLSPLVNVEASFLWFPLRQLYLELGLNFTFLFNKDDNSGCLRPWLGVGWQF
jgi:hypothetical protein